MYLATCARLSQCTGFHRLRGTTRIFIKTFFSKHKLATSTKETSPRKDLPIRVSLAFLEEAIDHRFCYHCRMERKMETLPNATIDKISSLLGSCLLQISPPFPAFSHHVHTVQSQKGQIWIVRVARDEFAARLASRGMAVMRHILSQRPELPIPAVFHADQECTILTYIEGSPLGSWNPVDLSVERRQNLLDGLANFLCQLWTCPISTTESGKEYYVQNRPDIC